MAAARLPNCRSFLVPGALFLPQPMDQGSVVKLTFQTERGPVLGTAEMLVPVTDAQQPFRFVALPESDQCTVQAAFTVRDSIGTPMKKSGSRISGRRR